MNIRTFSIAGLMAVTVLGSSALFAQESRNASVYTYDTQLDVARVVRIDEPQPPTCEVVQAKMTYVSTRGTVETLTFLKEAAVCISNG